MTERKTDTIKISGGVDYAKVAARSAEFHRDNETCEVATSCEFKEGHVLFTATVTTKKGMFTGHSLGKIGRQKAFEKLETIAVGRALAFAGYLTDGGIACAEEMESLGPPQQHDNPEPDDSHPKPAARSERISPHEFELFLSEWKAANGEDKTAFQSWVAEHTSVPPADALKPHVWSSQALDDAYDAMRQAAGIEPPPPPTPSDAPAGQLFNNNESPY